MHDTLCKQHPNVGCEGLLFNGRLVRGCNLQVIDRCWTAPRSTSSYICTAAVTPVVLRKQSASFRHVTTLL